jgi:Carboxypeptidase regulatory-like domain
VKTCLLLLLTLGALDVTRLTVMCQAARVGVGPDALPAVSEVPLAAPLQPGFAARVGLGYGFTESVLHTGEAHHRTQLDIAASLVARPWFAAAVRLLGRYDLQAGGSDSGDHGLITEGQLHARTQLPLTATLQAGAELALWLPGANTIGDSPRALSGDLQLFATYLPTHSPLTLGLALGLRVDRSKFSGGDPSSYSSADRLTLGVSDSLLAARMGVAASYRVGRLSIISEWSWDMYLDYPDKSPMWILAGARYHVSGAWQLEALLGVSPSQRPSLAEGAPLARIEPRFSAGLSAALAFPWASTAQPIAPESSANSSSAMPPIAAATTAVVRGHVSTPAAVGVAGASVTLEAGDQTLSTESDARGFFAFADLPAGSYHVRVSAKGWTLPERDVELRPGVNPAIELTLKRALPKGQIRGTVRSFDGTPLAAVISVPALGIQQTTGSAGVFEIDVPPGEYDVLATVPGFTTQKRRARVELLSVAILIMELQPNPHARR